jgi:hypothetical protein
MTFGTWENFHSKYM